MVDPKLVDLTEVTELVATGNFLEAEDLIDQLNFQHPENLTEESAKRILLFTRIKFHRSDIDGADNLLKRLVADVTKYDTEIQLQVLSLRSIFQGLKGNWEISEELVKQIESTTSFSLHLDTSVDFLIAKALQLENHGYLDKGIQALGKALKTFEDPTKYVISALIYYKIANLYQKKGYLDEANNYLQKCISLNFADEKLMPIDAANTFLGQNNLMLGNYDLAKKYLEVSVELWEKSNSPFGLAWALGEVAVLHYISGDAQSALNISQKLYSVLQNKASPAILSRHLLSLIRFSITIEDHDGVAKYYQKLKDFCQDSDDPVIESNLKLAEALIQKSKTRLSDKLVGIKLFENLSTNEDYFIRLEALFHQFELILLELKLTEDNILRDNLSSEAKEIGAAILRHIREKYGISFELQAAVIRSNLSILEENRKRAQEIMDLALEKSTSSGLELQKQKILEFYSLYFGNPSESQKPEIQLNKNIHSIPKLKILMYLLPRTYATFSEMQKNLFLSAGNLNGQCGKLEEIGYIYKDKVFLSERPTTIFQITPSGLKELRNYVNTLKNYFKQIF